MRIMYNYWMGHLELNQINENEIDKINEKCRERNIDPWLFFFDDNFRMIFKRDLFNSYFLETKITALWLKQVEDLKKQIEETSWINWLFNNFKKSLEILNKIKYILWVSITIILILLIFVFDIKVSGYIKKIPLLSSVINTDILEKFEQVNENDAFYKQIKKELKINKSTAQDSTNDEVKWILQDFNIFGKNESNTINSSKNVSSFKNGLNVIDIVVRNINSNEKIFRITLENWEQKFINVLKDKYWKFSIKMPNDLLDYKSN